MTISKIKNKYCANNKVQVMFSNAPRQIILSKDGYVYLREKDVTIHRYLTDPVRKEMPYKNHPSSSNHATHLFEYDKIYVKFTRYRNMYREKLEDSYSLTFLYFVKTENGEALCAEVGVKSFKSEKETTQIFSKAELEKFLYTLADGENAKCIFDWFDGIQYVKHNKEEVDICNEGFLNLSDEEIVRQYNLANKPMCILDELRRPMVMADESWKVQNIEEVKDFVLTYHGFTDRFSPMLLVIKDDEMYVYEFKVTFLEKDCFEVKSKRRKIAINCDDILPYARNCEYTYDVFFKEE